MIVGVTTESCQGETRVALVPSVVPELVKAGMEVLVQKGAGERAGFRDGEYEERGARLAAGRGEVLESAGLLLLVRGSAPGAALEESDLEGIPAGRVLVGLLNPLGAPQGAELLAGRRIDSYSLELLPRISRAQPMDILTSMATVAGYKVALMAADAMSKLYPMMVTPAGTISPARVFIIGVGVAGLQAIATSKRLGAVVTAYDIRPEVRDQVVSVGGKFLDLGLEAKDASAKGGYARAMDEEFYRKQREAMLSAVSESDAVITTAAVPGKKAPKLVTEEMVKAMRPGSIIVDLAAEGGGNCELTRPGETVEAYGVRILGPQNVPATMATHASQMFAKNISAFLRHIVKDGEIRVDPEDPILNETCLTRDGEVASKPVRERLGLPTEPAVAV